MVDTDKKFKFPTVPLFLLAENINQARLKSYLQAHVHDRELSK